MELFKRISIRLANGRDRLKQQDKWPRSWWYPEQNPVRRKKNTEAVQKRYLEYVLTVRRTMLTLLAFCFFCIVTVFGTPDSALITSGAEVELPFANVGIEFVGFLVAAPFLLIVLLIYLHVFNSSRLLLEREYNVHQVPTLFTMNRPLANALTYLIFYWLVPGVLAAIAIKAFARPQQWGFWLLEVTVVVTGALIWAQIRACPSEERRSGFAYRLCWFVLILLIFGVGYVLWTSESFRRPLNLTGLFSADLEEKYFVNADLRDATLSRANLQGANLLGADLRGAKLDGANLQGANLQRADLRGASLQRADLQRAKLDGAETGSANFLGALLVSVDLSVNENLTQDQINSTYGDANTSLPDRLDRPTHWPTQDLEPEQVNYLWTNWLASRE